MKRISKFIRLINRNYMLKSYIKRISKTEDKIYLDNKEENKYIDLNELVFDNILYSSEQGESLYYSIEDRIDYNKINIITFPKEIKDISISFVKGFIKNIEINNEEFDKYFIINCDNEKIVDKFYKSIYY